MRLSVLDRGIGIPPGELEAVFDKFYRVPRAEIPAGIDITGGLGLGLSISRGLVKAQGGHIWAENRAGGGTTVTLSLPIATQINEES